MSKPISWTDLITPIPPEVGKSLEHFLTFSELRTGEPTTTENRLLETLSISLAKRRSVN